jgi:hypothetical protein
VTLTVYVRIDQSSAVRRQMSRWGSAATHTPCRAGICNARDVAAAGWSPRRFAASACFLFAVALVAAAGEQPGSATTTISSKPTNSAPLSAPKTSVAQDGQFLTKVTEADSALATYEQKRGNIALRALLTDGSAFCAFLQRGAGIDNALTSVAIGARSDEAKTHLPLSVTTFNSIEAVALLTLCPHDQKLLPASDRSKIRKLGIALSKPAG